MLAPHVSDLTSLSSGAFLQAVFADLVCGNTRTTRHVQPLQDIQGVLMSEFIQHLC